MKISENMIAILKNVAGLSNGFVLVPGKRQMAIAPSDSILIEVDFDEPVDEEFSVHGDFMSTFLSTLNIFKGGDLEFKNNSVIMKNTGLAMVWRSAESKLIKRPKESIKLENPDVQFDIGWDILNRSISLANINGLENLSFVGENGKLLVKVHNRKNTDSNFGTFEIGETNKNFVSHFLTNDMKFLNGDYRVRMSLGQFSSFENVSSGERLIRYVVAEQY